MFETDAGGGIDMLVGESPVMQALRSRVTRVGITDFTVLVEGESGAGKELVARALHHVSRRRLGPFVAVNCAALVETLLEAELFGIEDRTATGVSARRGKFELADRGTLFLDEVSDLSPAAQAKLLRVLQDLSVERVGGHTAKTIDTRIIAATNRRLEQQVKAGLFREDLFYRLSGVEVEVPALRARRDDIPQLVEYLLGRHQSTRVLAVSTAALDAMVAYDWPGNVRQLERVLERAIALTQGDLLTVADLPPSITQGYRQVLEDLPDAHDTLRTWSSRYVRLVLDRCEGNKRRACEVLDISYHTLRSHICSRLAPHRMPDGLPGRAQTATREHPYRRVTD
ncbi:MAG: sigma-54-dependent Fis family transcriptional regulator [Acidobacteria bacterium]|nr:sigma-54-dependent Fis family transcriptional regulator [Acidobacteriota bacterium]